MSEEITKFCLDYEENIKNIDVFNNAQRIFIQRSEEFVRNRWKEIVCEFYCSERWGLARKYALISSLADIIKVNDTAFSRDEDPVFTNTTSEMRFFYKFMEDWNDFAEKGINLEDWSDLCERGLKLLMDFIKSPKRMKKDFLWDDEYDAFRDDYLARFKVLRLKYDSLNRYC